MSLPESLADCRIAILGLGLMGGSLALKLRGQCRMLVGCDPDPATLSLARRLELADQLADQPVDILPQADLLILAAPVGTILKLLETLPELHPGSAAVLDLGSTKVQIVACMQALPERFDPLGGHPMCGKERGGLDNADPELYRSATFAFTPLPRSSPRLRALAGQLAQWVGADPLWLDAETHDRWAAAVSHTPYLASNALAAITPPEACPLVGPGLRSATRLAPTHWAMMRAILETNRPNILEGLGNLRRQIEALEQALETNDWQTLEKLTTQGVDHYEALVGSGTGG